MNGQSQRLRRQLSRMAASKVWKNPPRRSAENTLYIRYVRGNPRYGVNDFHEHGEGTITTRPPTSCGPRAIVGRGMNWSGAGLGAGAERRKLTSAIHELATAQCQGTAKHRGLHARPGRHAFTGHRSRIFRPRRSPTAIIRIAGRAPTHRDGPPGRQGSAAIYLASVAPAAGCASPEFSNRRLVDVHGAGAAAHAPEIRQSRRLPLWARTEGDVIRINNFCKVRAGIGFSKAHAARG